MNTVGRFFLRARHWQLLAVMICPYLLAMASVFAAGLVGPLKSGGLVATEALMVLSMLCFMGWVGSIGLFFNGQRQPSGPRKTGFLWFALVFPSLYIFLFIAYFFSTGPVIASWIIVPPHLLAMFCIFYTIYFAAKSLAAAQASQPVTFYDYAGPFFLIWFFPLGIWVLQPRINRLYAQSTKPRAG